MDKLIKIQSSAIIFSRQKTALESKIADLKADNDARYKELTSGINLDEIKQRAQKLGMKPANENQIVYYEIEHELPTPMRCIAPMEVVSGWQQDT